MSRFGEELARLLSRVEILARGVDDMRRDAERALDRGELLEARTQARLLLTHVPRSPHGLALWADAAEGLRFDHEVVIALTELSQQLPWRQDVWLRLGLAQTRQDDRGARMALERATTGTEGKLARQALLALADADIALAEFDRAERWLDRIPYHPRQADPEFVLRRAECALWRHDIGSAGHWVALIRHEDDPSGRGRLARARYAALVDDGAQAIRLATGAFVLGAPGADAVLAELVAACRFTRGEPQAEEAEAALGVARTVVTEAGHADEPRWRAAFALQAGRRTDAMKALRTAMIRGDQAAVDTLLALAARDGDTEAIAELAEHRPDLITEGHRRILEAFAARGEGHDRRALELLFAIDERELRSFVERMIREILEGWVPASFEHSANWPLILAELGHLATELTRFDLLGPIEELAVERERPLRVAVLGEFNAGKSTFLNALLGTDVAPTGVRPTTATVHWVAWGPDPFARVVVEGAKDRLVPHAELKDAIAEVQASGARIRRVHIDAPIERLKRIEILDTPGFNAPDEDHIEQANLGVEEAHVALWLLDGTAPLKNSERQVLNRVTAAGVPVQVLINKRDRVGEEAIEQVRQYVIDALRKTGIESLHPPVAFSARQALAGRLGDPQAFRASHWEDVETLLEEKIVSECEPLRERALRRKAERIAVELKKGTLAAQEAASADRKAQLATIAQVRQFTAGLASDRHAVGNAILERLRPALAGLAADARPLSQLEGKPAAERSEAAGAGQASAIMDGASLRQYMAERSVARLAGPIVGAICEFAAAKDVPTEPLEPGLSLTVRAMTVGAASMRNGGVWQDKEVLLLIEAVVTELPKLLEQRAGAVDRGWPVIRRNLRAAGLCAAVAMSASSDTVLESGHNQGTASDQSGDDKPDQ